MAMLSIPVIFSIILCTIALRANAHFQNEDRLPMQWWLTGEVTWSAPRHLALAFLPTFAIFTFSAFFVSSQTAKPRAGQEHLVLPALIGLGATFIAVQLLHLWLVAKTLRRDEG